MTNCAQIAILIKLKPKKKFVQNVAPGLSTRFHIANSNVANVGELFRFEIGNYLEIACKVG